MFEEGKVGALYRCFDYSSVSKGYNKTEVSDYRGNFTNYSYEIATSRITSIIDRCGKVTNYTYDKDGRVVRVQKGDASVDYEYDGNGKLCKIINGKIDALDSTVEYDFMQVYNLLIFKPL